MFLPYVWMSLCSQRFKDFEWLVGIDGENDDSLPILNMLASQSSFPIKVISTDIHVGKSVIDNLLIESSRGEWVLWCDSDDFLLEDALGILQAALCNTNVSVSNFYCVLAALSKSLIPSIKIDKVESSLYSASLGEVFERYVKGDALICIKGERLRSERFPEVDFYCAEGVLWNTHLEDSSIYIDIPVMVRRYLEDGISLSRRILYPRAKFLTMQFNLERITKITSRNDKKIFYFLIQTLRFAMHTENTVYALASARGVRRFSDVALIVAVFCALMVYLRDLLFEKVVYTHLDFDRNMRSYRVTFTNWNWG